MQDGAYEAGLWKQKEDTSASGDTEEDSKDNNNGERETGFLFFVVDNLDGAGGFLGFFWFLLLFVNVFSGGFIGGVVDAEEAELFVRAR